MNEQERVYVKLEAIKDIRVKTMQLEKLKAKLMLEIEGQDNEEKCLGEYKQEMEMLLQEKMSHVEELRQIHADINAMEGVIKNAEECRLRSLSNAARLHEEYAPLKTEIDRMRRDCLGLERLPELHEEDGINLSPERLTQIIANTKCQSLFGAAAKLSVDWNRPLTSSDTPLGTLPPPPPTAFLPPPSASALRIASAAAAAAAAKASTTGDLIGRPHHPSGGPPPAPPSSHLSSAHHHSGPPTPTFRQQPPPMKSCLSCHQQIHRNAPICPLCKAKSRSRNPKKPKKKDH